MRIECAIRVDISSFHTLYRAVDSRESVENEVARTVTAHCHGIEHTVVWCAAKPKETVITTGQKSKACIKETIQNWFAVLVTTFFLTHFRVK